MVPNGKPERQPVRGWLVTLGMVVMLVSYAFHSYQENASHAFLELTNTGDYGVVVHFQTKPIKLPPGGKWEVRFREGETLNLETDTPGLAQPKRVLLTKTYALVGEPARVRAEVGVYPLIDGRKGVAATNTIFFAYKNN